MMGRTHKVGGVLSGAIASNFFYTDSIVKTGICTGALILGSVLGSLLPDIDKKESTIGRALWFISWPIYLLRLMLKLLSRIFPGIFKKVAKEMYEDLGHRGIAHSFVTWLIINGIFWISRPFILSKVPEGLNKITMYFNGNLLPDDTMIQNGLLAFLVGVSIGMLSHIMLDLFTPGGVRLLLPVLNMKFEIPFFKTGGIAEAALRKAMAGISILVTYRSVISYL